MPPSLLSPYDLSDRSPGDVVVAARVRVLCGFAAFAGGIVLSREVDVGVAVWFGLAALGAGAAACSRGPACRAAMVACVLTLGGGWGTLRLRERASPGIASLVGSDAQPRTLATIEGLVLDTPESVRPPRAGLAKFLHREPVVRFPLRATRVAGSDASAPASERVWVRVRGESSVAAKAGDRVRVTGSFAPVAAPTNPGQSDMRLWATQEGYAGTLTLPSATLIEPMPDAAGLVGEASAGAARARAWLRDRARRVLTLAAGGARDGPGGRADALVRGLILGDANPGDANPAGGDSGDDVDVQGAFARQGLAHILAISGFHLTVMSSLALMALRLTGDRGRLEPAIVAALVVAYALIVPPGSPVVRSAAMVLVLLAAEALGRRYDRLTLMGWIAIGLLVWRPLDLWSLGFQLSVGLTAMLFWAGSAFRDTLFTPAILGRARRAPTGAVRAVVGDAARASLGHLRSAIATAAMCWLVALPVVALRVGLVSPAGIAASVLVTPVIVGVLWIGYVALFVGLIVPAAAGWAGGVLAALANASVDLVAWFDRVPWSSVPVPPVSAAWAATATVVLAVLCRRGRWHDAGAIAALALAAWWFVAGAYIAGRLPATKAFRVDTLDVGDGSCHLLRSGRDAILWDAAPMGAAAGAPLPRAAAAARALGAWRVPRVVITHPDLDHFGGLIELVRPLGVREVLTCERFLDQARDEPGGAAATAIDLLRQRGVGVRALTAGDQLALGLCRVSILSPPRGWNGRLDNDHSLVARVEAPVAPRPSAGLAGERTAVAIFTGDVQDDAIAALDPAAVMRVPSPAFSGRPAVMEIPHHGSARQAAIDWVRALDPLVALQSTGRKRLDDPRWADVRERRAWLCTARGGAAWVSIGRDGTVRAGQLSTIDSGR